VFKYFQAYFFILGKLSQLKEIDGWVNAAWLSS